MKQNATETGASSQEKGRRQSGNAMTVTSLKEAVGRLASNIRYDSPIFSSALFVLADLLPDSTRFLVTKGQIVAAFAYSANGADAPGSSDFSSLPREAKFLFNQGVSLLQTRFGDRNETNQILSRKIAQVIANGAGPALTKRLKQEIVGADSDIDYPNELADPISVLEGAYDSDQTCWVPGEPLYFYDMHGVGECIVPPEAAQRIVTFAWATSIGRGFVPVKQATVDHGKGGPDASRVRDSRKKRH